jgi:hypothetical protein
MGAGAISAATLFLFTGWGERGLGALTSLCLMGPMLDLSVRKSKTGRRVYFSFIIAGVLTNLAAFAVQVTAKSFGLDSRGGKSLMKWLPFALMTYPTCGAIAGLLSAVVWFRWSGDRTDSGPDPTQ